MSEGFLNAWMKEESVEYIIIIVPFFGKLDSLGVVFKKRRLMQVEIHEAVISYNFPQNNKSLSVQLWVGGSQKSDQVLIPNPIVHTHVGSTNVVRSLRQRSTLVVQTTQGTDHAWWLLCSFHGGGSSTNHAGRHLRAKVWKISKKDTPIEDGTLDREPLDHLVTEQGKGSGVFVCI